MHILVIPSEHYIPVNAPLSGIFQFHHVSLLAEKNNKVGVISAGLVPFKFMFKAYPFKKFEESDGIPIYRDFYRMFMPGGIALKYFWKILVKRYLKLFDKYIERYGAPDIVHAHNSIFAGYVALELKRKYGIPFVLTEHSSLYERKLLSNNQLQLAKEVFTNADSITTVSTKLGKTLQNIYGSALISFTPIFNVLEKEFSEHAHSNKISKDTSGVINYLCIGSLDENKNHELLIRAFAKMHKSNPNSKLRIGGDGHLKMHLQGIIDELGINSNIELLGLLNRNEVRDEMDRADAFVLSSIVETFGVVLMEALSLGKPVIATKCGGPEDIVTKINGLLIENNDLNAMVEALMTMNVDYIKYSSNEIKLDCSNRFGRETFYQKLKSIYSNILVNKNETKNG